MLKRNKLNKIMSYSENKIKCDTISFLDFKVILPERSDLIYSKLMDHSFKQAKIVKI